MLYNCRLTQRYKHLMKFSNLQKNCNRLKSNSSSSLKNPIIQLQQGQIRGIAENNVYGVPFMAFRGIPYAEAPVGNLRFRDPKPVKPWSGIKDATEYGNQCPQVHLLFKKKVGDEDCLYLNVYTSNLNPAVPRAVMVWIHGGMFTRGSGADDLYGPDYLIEKDIVLVTINYRLGILGFLDLEDEIAPGNQGLKDQVLALKWVQQNIAKFGGDRNNVTIFGESSGGASVHYLTLSPLAEGLFHKAIMQSGLVTNPWVSPPHSIRKRAQQLSAVLGNEIADPKKLFEFLRKTDIHQLLDAQSSFYNWRNRFLIINLFGPTVDSKSKNPFMPLSIQEAVKAGVRVPCMIGYLSHEAIFLVANLKDDQLADIDKNQESLLLHPTVKRFLEDRNITVNDIKRVFIGDEKIEQKNMKKLTDLQSTVDISIGLHHVLEIQAKILHVPTYLYKFEYEYENAMMQKIYKIDSKGTCHGEDLIFLFYPKLYKLFGHKPPTPDSTEHLITRRFVELWTNFAKTGNPTPQTSKLIRVNWKPIDDPIEYNCLRISEDLSMIKDPNSLVEIKKKMKQSKL